MSESNLKPYQGQPVQALFEGLEFATAFNPIQREGFAKYFRAYQIAAEQTLVRQEDRNDNLFIICKGSFNVSILGPDNTNKVIQVLTKGKIIGEISFFDHGPISATVVANEDSVLLGLNRSDFLKLSSESPHTALAFSLELFRLLTQRIRQANVGLKNLL